MKLSRLMFIAVIATLAMTLSGCTGKGNGQGNGKDNGQGNGQKESQEMEYICTDPLPTQIYILPLNTYTEGDAKDIGLKLDQVTDEICMPVVAEILPTVQLGDEFKNDAGTRYRADKILDWLKKGPKPVIALTNDDISCTYKGVDDWGVLGLSYLGKDVCVVSTYRVKNKRDFWKVVYHEFGHAHYGLPHCPADDPTCIMQDAKGHPKFGPKKVICDSCWRKKHSQLK